MLLYNHKIEYEHETYFKKIDVPKAPGDNDQLPGTRIFQKVMYMQELFIGIYNNLVLRVLIYLRPTKELNLDFEYHHNIQGFIYSLLINTSFEKLHNKRGYKFFCFSNIFRTRIQENIYCLIISSPSEGFIRIVSYQLEKIQNNQTPIQLGKDYFFIENLKLISNNNTTSPIKVITSSPIIVRLHNNTISKETGLSVAYKEIYWNSNYPVNLFINAVETNLRKKYQEFTGNLVGKRLVQSFRFKRTVSTHIHIDEAKIPIIGTMWELDFSPELPREVQLFAMDSGLGERNSLGFGFLNPILVK